MVEPCTLDNDQPLEELLNPLPNSSLALLKFAGLFKSPCLLY